LLSRALLLAISFLLILVSFPGAGLPLLVCIAVAPALIATAGLKPPQSALVLGFWAWAWWLAALWWAIPSLTNFTDASGFISILLITCVCFFLALPYALTAFAIAYFKLWNSPLAVIQIALSFAVFISLCSSVLPAAPVNALFEYPVLLQLADIGGLPLLVFLYFVFNAAIASVFINKASRYIIAVPVLLLLPLVVLGYGYYKLSEEQNIPTTRMTIGYIQPLATAEDQLSSLIAQTRKLKQMSEHVELIIWPEVPVDFSWHDTQYERYRIRKIAQELDAHLIILPGYHYVNGENAGGGHFNSANFISNSGEGLAEYHKQKLVPFFEYVPLKEHLSSYFPNARDYIAGKQASLFKYKDRTLAPLICYEALFSDLVRPYIDEGVDIIINPGNDGWFGETGALSHLSLALLRSIEYRIPLIRVNNSGVSTVINHKGEILFETLSTLDTQTGRVFTLEIPNGERTFFYQYGNILNVLSLVFLCLSLICRRRKYTQNSSPDLFG
jgi:apolipoprotein N-acyltransferase